jgi:hypothetical protein
LTSPIVFNTSIYLYILYSRLSRSNLSFDSVSSTFLVTQPLSLRESHLSYESNHLRATNFARPTRSLRSFYVRVSLVVCCLVVRPSTYCFITMSASSNSPAYSADFSSTSTMHSFGVEYAPPQYLVYPCCSTRNYCSSSSSSSSSSAAAAAAAACSCSFLACTQRCSPFVFSLHFH